MIEELFDDSADRRALEVGKFYAAAVPTKLTNAFIKFVAKNFPHGEQWRHLRKVRKSRAASAGGRSTQKGAKKSGGAEVGGAAPQPTCIEVLLCPVDETSHQVSPAAVGGTAAQAPTSTLQEILDHKDLPCSIQPVEVLVPRHPATSAEVLAQVNAKIASLSYPAGRPPLPHLEAGPGIAWPQKLVPQKDAAPPPLAQSETTRMIECMELLLARRPTLTERDRHAAAAPDTSQATCHSSGQGVLFVDPQRDFAVVADCFEDTFYCDIATHPHRRSTLKHCVLRCVEKIARTQRQRRDAEGSVSTRTVSPEPLVPNRKRARMAADSAASKHVAASDSSQKDAHDSESDGVEYLATGFDAYLIVEPCPMCAMALVHSRVRRVVWMAPNPKRGALGTRYALHHQAGLNHHYRVFRFHSDGHSGAAAKTSTDASAN